MEITPSVVEFASGDVTPMDIGAVYGTIAALTEEPTIGLDRDIKLNDRYAEDLVTRLGLNDAKSAATPGSKDCGKGLKEYMSDHRVDSTLAIKERMRGAVEELDEYDGKVYVMIWVEEKCDDVFTATPETASMKYLTAKPTEGQRDKAQEAWTRR